MPGVKGSGSTTEPLTPKHLAFRSNLKVPRKPSEPIFVRFDVFASY